MSKTILDQYIEEQENEEADTRFKRFVLSSRRFGAFLLTSLFTLLGAIGKVVAGVGVLAVLVLVGSVVGGFVVQHLWAWFVVGIGFPAISLARAVGLTLVFDIFLVGVKKETFEGKRASYAIYYWLGVNAASLGLGYIIHRFFI